jgi:hypothetical protein
MERSDLTRNERLYVKRMRFTRLSFDLIDQYTQMSRAGATECDYPAACAAGRKGIQTRLELARMNSTFTTRVIGPAAEPTEGGPFRYFSGEVRFYGDMGKLTDGTDGRLLMKLPLQWAFRRDPNDTGLMSGFAYKPVDLSYWEENGARYAPDNRKDYPTSEWEMVRTDRYVQSQGVLHPDQQDLTSGYCWYRTTVQLSEAQLDGKVRVRFPAVFGDCWLWVNGRLLSYRPQQEYWWRRYDTLRLDVELSAALKPGENILALRVRNQRDYTGMVARPFLYVPAEH